MREEASNEVALQQGSDDRQMGHPCHTHASVTLSPASTGCGPIRYTMIPVPVAVIHSAQDFHTVIH